MKKEKEMLKAKKEDPRLENGRVSDFSSYGYFGKRKNSRLKKWYMLYIATTLTAIVAVLLLLVVGVSSNNTPLSEGVSVRHIADKIGSFFSGIDFFAKSDIRNDAGGGFIPLPDADKQNNGNGNNIGEGNDQEIPAGADGEGLYYYDYSQVPEGFTPIIPMDLSLSSYGNTYINNSTGYSPDTKYLLNKELGADKGYVPLAQSSSPLVLIIHTHGTEAYSEDGAKYCDDSKDYARTSDARKSVVAVGEAISNILNQNGIPTVHCKILHDSVQYKDSYSRAEQTIKKYLEEYPSIRLVIDIHRDSVIKSSGEIVRPVTNLKGEAAAQVMCVVGSDWAGDEHPAWENDLSLALKLREELNNRCEGICRPVFLKGNTYNQELSEYSLLIEVGSSGNSLAEAQRSAELIAEALTALIPKI